jgi:hypothetical protein
MTMTKKVKVATGELFNEPKIYRSKDLHKSRYNLKSFSKYIPLFSKIYIEINQRRK